MKRARVSSPSYKSLAAWKGRLIALGAGIFLLLLLVIAQAAFNLTFLRPDTSQQTFFFAALSALTFLLLLALSFVLLRNLLKLYAERRIGVLGSNFRARMVMGALMLSFVPVLFMFLFAYGLMNRSIDKWFSRPVEELREDSARVASLLSGYAAETARAQAAVMAASPEVRHAFATQDFTAVIGEFRRHKEAMRGGFAIALLDDDAVASFHLPEPWGALRTRLPAATEGGAPIFRINETDYLLGIAPVAPSGRILVAMPLPGDVAGTLNQIEQSQRRYWELASQRKLVRRTYMLLLLLITVLVLFAATWLSLLVSRLVTRPVAALAEATQQISRGRLDYRVAIPAADELGELVASFNRMAAELESSQRQLEASSRELAAANTQLESRRRHIETLLESIPTGVLSLDAERRVTHSNRAFQHLFTAGAAAPSAGAGLRDLFPGDVAEALNHLLRKADRMGMTSAQMEITAQRARLDVALTAASLGRRQGYVIVFEDFTDLLRAQKQAAWREVAQRIAHEIKNPLTPIALSAERIRRHLQRAAAASQEDHAHQPDEASLEVIRGCAETITAAVETVRTLVDEFSALARFPAARPQPSDINSVVESALAMFNGRLDNIHVETHLASGLPPVMADPEAIKRALANLVDNAAEALEDSLLREIHISTALLTSRDAVEIVVADTGHGVSRELKEKLFLPYFSTKKRGTGLGLAIVSRIVEDHSGAIRVEENQPLGARFIVELPVASKTAPHA